jgi:hypothetical protein
MGEWWAFSTEDETQAPRTRRISPAIFTPSEVDEPIDEPDQDSSTDHVAKGGCGDVGDQPGAFQAGKTI